MSGSGIILGENCIVVASARYSYRYTYRSIYRGQRGGSKLILALSVSGKYHLGISESTIAGQLLRTTRAKQMFDYLRFRYLFR